MPVYAYVCKACGHQFEQRQSFSDAPIRVCPSCGQEQVRKQFNSVGVVFKGSGFYRTDSRSSSSSGDSSSGSGGSGSDSSGGSGASAGSSASGSGSSSASAD